MLNKLINSILLLAVMAFGVSGGLVAADAIDDITPVTDEMLLNPSDGDWLMWRRTYDGWGYSPLDQIDADNVADLVPVWSFSTGVNSGHEAPAIVNDGVMFVTTPGNQVIAIDARTGDLIWLYEHEMPEDVIGFHYTNRGVALFGDKVFMATLDARIVALDAATGEVVWSESVADNSSGYYMTLAPLTARGKVMVGVSGGELGIRGFVVALDTETGEEVWRTHTVPSPGEPGSESWQGDAWQTGGAAVWLTGHYDPELGLTYWGTGNPGPWMGDVRPGDNLYSNSVVALNVDTGELVGHHQYHWNGSWDWDEVSTPLLIDVERDGRTFPALVHPGRNGYLWLLERSADAISFVDAWPYVRQDVFINIDPKTGRPTYDPLKKPSTGTQADFCPSLWGGKDWPPAAYNPGTGLLYIPANDNLCGTIEGQEVVYRPGRSFVGARTGLNVWPGADHIGELQAWNMNTGEKVWTREFDSPNWGPVMTTAGNLVFMGGTSDRYFRAFDARTGDQLWQQRTNSGVIGVPSSYMVDGVQYIAVQSGFGVDAASMRRRVDSDRGTETYVPQGGVIWVFALGG